VASSSAEGGWLGRSDVQDADGGFPWQIRVKILGFDL
jgi:hypothetical protein